MKVDLTKVEIKDLVKELNDRKKVMIPEIVETINDNIQLLKELGIEIEDSSDCDYVFDRFKITSDGNIEFETIYR